MTPRRPDGGFDRDHPPENAWVLLGRGDVHGVGDAMVATDELVERVTSLLWGPGAPRFAVCVGLAALDAVSGAWALRRDLCRKVWRRLVAGGDFAPPGYRWDEIEYEIDGWGVNPNFMGTGHDFRSTRTLHFDIVEPFGSNLYEPTEGVEGGWPVFADLRAYCADEGLAITDVLVKIPGARNLSIARAHYAAVTERYAVSFAVDGRDAPFTLITNLVIEAGIVHGATDPWATGGATPRRRLWHLAFDDVSDEAAVRWYRTLGHDGGRAPGDPVAEKPLLVDNAAVAPRVLKPPPAPPG